MSVLRAAVLFAFAATLAVAADAARLSNRDVAAMIGAGVPDSAIVFTIQDYAWRGSADLDTTPEALIELRRAGASGAVLEALIAAQAMIGPGVGGASARALLYKDVPLTPFVLWASAEPRGMVMPTYTQATHSIAVDAPGQPVSESQPSFRSEGYPADRGWELVAMPDRVLRVHRKNAFGSDFFSDRLFDASDLIALRAEAGTLRPAAPLKPGGYALCAQEPTGGWMRICYAFTVGR